MNPRAPQGEMEFLMAIKRYYAFGLRAGSANFFANGWSLGVKKTLGKILQPINFYGRFPEYFFFERGLESLWNRSPTKGQIRLLDVGSPKLFGLYLAYRYPVKVWLTDISPVNIDEYRLIWDALSAGAKGQAIFEIQDGRRLSYPGQMFDGVYSLSVIEHIVGEDGDSQAREEIVRVLRPGGRIAISVPFAPEYQEQLIRGLKGAAEKTRDGRLYFLQRIYDFRRFRERVIGPLGEQWHDQRLVTVRRRNLALVKLVHWLRYRLGEDAMGALGFINPLLGWLCNAAEEGAKSQMFVRMGPVYDARHIYGDIIWTATKN